jgi:hypothetical protein
MKVKPFSRDNSGWGITISLFDPDQYKLHPMHQKKTAIGINSSEIALFLTGIVSYRRD